MLASVGGGNRTRFEFVGKVSEVDTPTVHADYCPPLLLALVPHHTAIVTGSGSGVLSLVATRRVLIADPWIDEAQVPTSAIQPITVDVIDPDARRNIAGNEFTMEQQGSRAVVDPSLCGGRSRSTAAGVAIRTQAPSVGVDGGVVCFIDQGVGDYLATTPERYGPGPAGGFHVKDSTGCRRELVACLGT